MLPELSNLTQVPGESPRWVSKNVCVVSQLTATEEHHCWAFKGNNSHFLPRDPLFCYEDLKEAAGQRGSGLWVSVAVATEMAEGAQIYQGGKHFFPKEKFVSISVCYLKEVKYFGGLWEISYILKDCCLIPEPWEIKDMLVWEESCQNKELVHADGIQSSAT